MVRRSIFEKIFREMQLIHHRLNDLEKALSARNPQPVEVQEPKLMALSDHLRKTYLTVASRGECDAETASVSTGRCRALESNYLNQLCRMGWLNKRRVSKTAIFSLTVEDQSSLVMADPRLAVKPVSANILNSDFKKYFGGY